MSEVRRLYDVTTGRLIPRPSGRITWGSGPHRECAWKAHVGQKSWWVISLFSCPDCPACQGFEVCLFFRDRSGSQSPIWPVISARSEEEAEGMRKDLMKVARTWTPQWHTEDGEAVRSLKTWLTQRGYTKHSPGPCWWPPAAE